MEKTPNRFYNYLYLDPEKPGSYKIKGLDIILTHEPFYVGKGCGERWRHHMYVGRSGAFMKNKIESLINKKLKPIVIIIIKNIMEFESCENEKYLIKVIGRRDLGKGPLCNLTDGGEEGYRQIISEECRKKISKANTGKKRSKESIERSVATRRKNYRGRSDYFKKRMSEVHRGKIPPNLKGVIKIDRDGNYIKEYGSIKEACLDTGLNRNTIARHISGKIKVLITEFSWILKPKNA